MSDNLKKAFSGNSARQASFLLNFIKKNGLNAELEASLSSLLKNETKTPSVYTLEAHSNKVTDLPFSFMIRLKNSMIDISHVNDDAARFVMLHEDGDKAYHLWIDYADKEMREEGASRFSASIIHLDEFDKDCEHDFAGYITSDVFESIIDTDSVYELSTALASLTPKMSYFGQVVEK